MANQPRVDNPGRVVRIEDKLWTAAKALADERGVPVSQVVRDALRGYVDDAREVCEDDDCDSWSAIVWQIQYRGEAGWTRHALARAGEAAVAALAEFREVSQLEYRAVWVRTTMIVEPW